MPISSLWRHGGFLKLWAAQAVSAFGARITREGLPFAAVLTLKASPAELGLLAAFAMGPRLVVGLMAGGYVDRTSRRRLMIRADLGRAAMLASVPAVGWLGWLSMPQLYLVAAVVGAASVLFDLADHAFLPSLVGRGQLVDANGKLAVTESAAEIGGPALAGLLFQLLTAPVAIACNAASYLVSALFLAAIPADARPQAPAGEVRPTLLQDLRLGFAAALGHPLIRPLLLMTLTNSVFGAIFAALYVIYALETLHLTAALLGLTIAVGGVGALIGAAIAPPMIRWIGPGPTIVWGGLIAGASSLLIPFAHGSPSVAAGYMMAAQLFGDSFAVAMMIPAASLRQAVLPSAVLGRVGAVFHVVGGGLSVAGALAGGLLPGLIGMRESLYVAAIGVALTPLIALFSPLRSLRETPVSGSGDPASPAGTAGR